MMSAAKRLRDGGFQELSRDSTPDVLQQRYEAFFQSESSERLPTSTKSIETRSSTKII